jgi:aryl-alcohol dehydrogenase-like predicted oxidoreductase
MQYTTLGSTGLKISRIALGCMSVTLSDDEVAVLEKHYTPRQPMGY